MSATLDLLNPYAALMRLRRAAYHAGVLHSEHPGIPVISVGNLTMGGSGKTPLTIALGKYLHAKGKRVAVVSRGYGRASEGFVLVQDGTQLLADVAKSGDEAQLIAMTLPNAIVIVDEDRVHGAKQAKHLGAEIVLLDDGYQHMRIRRDLNILVVDSSRTLGEVIPFGMLREPPSAAADADVVVYTNAAHSSGAAERILSRYLRPGIPIARVATRAETLLPLVSAADRTLSSLKNARVLAVSSIAAPERFYQVLREAGAIVTPHTLRDHAAYDRTQIERIKRHAASSAAELIVTTAKDGVKSASFFAQDWDGPPVYILPITLEFMEGERPFYHLIDTHAHV